MCVYIVFMQNVQEKNSNLPKLHQTITKITIFVDTNNFSSTIGICDFYAFLHYLVL